MFAVLASAAYERLPTQPHHGWQQEVFDNDAHPDCQLSPQVEAGAVASAACVACQGAGSLRTLRTLKRSLGR